MNNTMSDSEYQCIHYKSNCFIIAPCCNKIYDCRQCHDDIEYASAPQNLHKMDRFNVKKIICKHCNMKQPFANKCIQCSINMGKYFCDKCCIIDNNDKIYYHCDKCKICRCGEKNEYVHCDKCNGCFLIETHDCSKNIHRESCPICFEEFFDFVYDNYPFPLECGHFVHTQCLKKHSQFSIRCPVCNKSIQKMSINPNFKDSMPPVPDELKDKQSNILCNDCLQKTTIAWHYYALVCPHCNSINTSEI